MSAERLDNPGSYLASQVQAEFSAHAVSAVSASLLLNPE
jgi:hypothetical protein